VADNICLGTRHFLDEVRTEGDPLTAIADRYLSHLSCPRIMNDFDRRFDYLLSVKKDYGIDGAIIEKLKFCDLWGGEIYNYRVEAKKKSVPLLAMERELYGGAPDRLKQGFRLFWRS